MLKTLTAFFFSEDGILRLEFDEPYHALFSNADLYIEVVKLLCEHKSGLPHKEISKAIRFEGGKLTRVLQIWNGVISLKNGRSTETRNGRPDTVWSIFTQCSIISSLNLTVSKTTTGGVITSTPAIFPHRWEMLLNKCA